MKRVAVDAMGGDLAPENPVAGAFQALTQDPLLYITLVGQNRLLKTETAKYSFPPDRCEIIHAAHTIRMDEPPVAALRRKKDSSIKVALTLHRMGKVEAVVSAGSTGAQVVASVTSLGRIEGVLRPVIGSLIPTEKGFAFLLDVGANTDCSGIHLFQFGVMGAVYMEKVMGVNRPRVAMLSMGAEKTKGNDVSLFAYHLLSKSHLNFIGNVEGNDILTGKVDVAVCDGFVGNLLLKFAESFPLFLLKKFTRDVSAADSDYLKKFLYTNFHPEIYGGVPILGVNGISVVCHGSSSPKAIANAIHAAAAMMNKDICQNISRALAELHRFYEINKYYLNIKKRWLNRRKRLGFDTSGFFNWFGEKPADNS